MSMGFLEKHNAYSNMDFSTTSTLMILTITAIGVFAGPLLAERKKKLNERKNSHFNKIKNECLKPMIESINGLVWNNFTLKEQIYNYQGALQHKEFLDSGLTNIKTWYSLINNASSVDRLLNKLLYDDIHIHFPKLQKNIDDVQKFLDECCYEYEKKRNDLVIKLFVTLEPKIIPALRQNDSIGMFVSVALFCIFDYDRSFWPNYYNITFTNNILKIIQETIENQDEIKNLGKTVKEIHDKARSKLPLLRNEMEKIMDYEGELKGKCDFI